MDGRKLSRDSPSSSQSLYRQATCTGRSSGQGRESIVTCLSSQGRDRVGEGEGEREGWGAVNSLADCAQCRTPHTTVQPALLVLLSWYTVVVAVLCWLLTTSLALWLRRPTQEEKIRGSIPVCDGIFFPGRVIPVTYKLALQ